MTPDVVTRGVTIVGAHDGHDTPLENDHQCWTQANIGSLFLTYVQRGQMRVAVCVSRLPLTCPAVADRLRPHQTAVAGCRGR